MLWLQVLLCQGSVRGGTGRQVGARLLTEQVCGAEAVTCNNSQRQLWLEQEGQKIGTTFDVTA